MKTFIISTLLLLAFGINSEAQNLIAVQNGSKVQFYASLDSAYVHSSDGDTLNLPGGSYGSLTVDKSLTIIGVGHNPDSTKATGKTLLAGLVLNSGADKGSVTGIYFSGNIVFNSEVNGFTISRCYLSSINYSAPLSNAGSKLSIIENIIGSLNLPVFSNCLVSNNIIGGTFHASNDVFQNNNFISQNTDYMQTTASNCTFKNNFFSIYFHLSSFYNCIFYNNFNIGVNGSSSGNQGSGNLIVDEYLDSLFVNYNHTAYLNIYKDDFHLVSNSPYKNAGTDGTAIGIYGGVFPWKDGSLPYNPHIKINSVAGTTDANGNLKVNITVEAQGH